MALSIKELAIVLAIALSVFTVLRPIVRRFASDTDLKRRRFVWYALTATAFLSPNVWLFTAVAIPLLLFSAKRDSNPAALYLFLLYVIPPFSWRIPMIGISHLLDLTPTLLLSLCVATPPTIRLLRRPIHRGPQHLDIAGLCILSYALLTSFCYVRAETSPGVLMSVTFTDCLRRALELLFSLYVPYFLISRSLLTYRAILDSLSSAILAAVAMGAIGIFESSRNWLLYSEIMGRWSSDIIVTEYLMRGSHLRAMASSGQPLALASVLALAFGFWLSVQYQVDSRRTRILTLSLLLIGLYVTYSRGPLLAAALIFLLFSTLRPGLTSKTVKVLVIVAALGMVAFQLTAGLPLTHEIPLVGSMGHDPDYLYRVRLWNRAWQLIAANPIFGDQHAYLEMENLRQGQGIIDLVNGYVVILLGSGIVGLSLWASFVVIGLLRAGTLCRSLRFSNPQLSILSASLISCTLATMFMIASGGSMDPLICVLTGLSIACANLRHSADSTLPARSAVTTT